MTRFLFILIPGFFLQTAAFSQNNLVPNGDFEDVRAIPDGVSQFPLARPWVSAAQGPEPADLFHKRSKAIGSSAPKNYVGSQEPFNGEAYGGIALLRKGKKDYREFMNVPLTEPLEKGVEYDAEMYVSLSDFSELATSSLGMLFSQKPPLLIQDGFLLSNPQIVLSPKNIVTDKNIWVKIGGRFRAEGGETMLTIGNFIAKDDSPKKNVKSTAERGKLTFKQVVYTIKEKDDDAYAYYYIDAVKVTRVGGDPGPLVATASPYFGNVTSKKPVRLNNIFFRPDEAVLLEPSFDELDKLYDFLAKNPAVSIRINGHTDITSNPEYNRMLSENRAKAVKTYLVRKGIDNRKIETQGFGDTQPVATNETEEGKQLNRRVEFEVLP